MKPLLALFILCTLAFGGYYYFQTHHLDQVPLGTMLSSDTQSMVTKSLRFMEDIKYKDFDASAQYSLPEQRGKYDLAALVEGLFKVKPEFLDIQHYEVISTDLDSQGERARVHMKANVKLLNTDELKEPELILYFKKQSGEWYMDYATSLGGRK